LFVIVSSYFSFVAAAFPGGRFFFALVAPAFLNRSFFLSWVNRPKRKLPVTLAVRGTFFVPRRTERTGNCECTRERASTQEKFHKFLHTGRRAVVDSKQFVDD
jgi:hypothetical protein